MGNHQSVAEPKRRNNDPGIQLRGGAPNIRNSSTRMSKTEKKAHDIDTTIKELRRAIDAYDGIRGTPNYKALHSQLSRKGQEVQELLMKSNKPIRQTRFKTFQREINNLFKLLEERVERNERQLDSAAVESHSFISPKPADYTAQKSYETTLDEVEQRASILEEEISKAISIEDKSKYKLLEQKLNMLYADLTKIDDTSNKTVTRKESINKSLMRQAKKLQNIKQEKRPSLKKPIDDTAKEERQTIEKIEEELSDVEVRVMTFEDLKAGPKYMELDQVLKGYWAALSNLGDTVEENRRRKLKTIDLIKKILQELSKRAEENSAKINNALDKVNDIEDDALAMKNSVEKFRGVENDTEYSDIDQKLRTLWGKLNDIHNNYEAVVKKKSETIKTIQCMLKTLLQNAQRNASNDTYENVEVSRAKSYNFNEEQDIIPKPPVAMPRESVSKSYLLEDLEEYENKWIVLDKSIRNNMKREEIEQIRSVVQNLERNFSKTLQYLNKLSVRNSTGNIAKVSASPLQYCYQQPVEKVTIKQTETEPIRKVASSQSLSKNLEPEGRNLSPPERLITELTVSRSLTNLSIINQDLDALKTKILHSEQSNDLSKLELQKLQNKLLNLETCLNPTVVDQRNKTTQRFSEIFTLLDSARLKKETVEETNRLKAIVEVVQKLKKKVDCFTGTYKSVLYVNIEDGLKDCLKALADIVSDNEKINKTKEQLKNKIERYLEILDERSLKVGSQEDITEVPKPSFTQRASSIVSFLTKIRTALESFDGGPETIGISSDMSRCEKMIKDLDPANDNQKTIQDQYVDYLNKLVLYFESHVNDESKIQNITPEKMLIQLEHEVTELKNQITKLNAIESDAEFERAQLELDDLLVRVNSVETLTSGDKEFRNNLQGSIQSLTSLLKTKRRASKRMSQYNEQLNKVKLEEVQDAIGKLSDEVHNFSENNYRQRYDELDEEMTNIFLKIQGLDVECSMRDYLIRQIQSHKKLLQQKLQDIACADKRGTEV